MSSEQDGLKEFIKVQLRPGLEAEVANAMDILAAKGIPTLRLNVIRALRTNVAEQVGKRWAKECGRMPIAADELRVVMAAFNEVMDELAAESTQ